MSKYRRSYFHGSKHQQTVRSARATHETVLSTAAHGESTTVMGFWSRYRGLALRLSAVVAVLGMGMVYLGTIGITSQNGFEMLGHQQKITELQKENQRLELRTRELESLSRAEHEALRLGLVKGENVVYLPDTDSNVAVVD